MIMVVQTLCVAEPSNVYDFLSLTSLSSHVFIFHVPFTDPFYSSNTSADPVLFFIRSNFAPSIGPFLSGIPPSWPRRPCSNWSWFTWGCCDAVLGFLFSCSPGTHFLDSCPLLSWFTPLFCWRTFSRFFLCCYCFLRKGAWDVKCLKIILPSHLIPTSAGLGFRLAITVTQILKALLHCLQAL